MNPTQLRTSCLSLTGAEETFPFGPRTSVFKVARNMSALTQLRAESSRASMAQRRLSCPPSQSAPHEEK
jgi:predicted DNA-binding protein (MmcQ/YjbR family)